MAVNLFKRAGRQTVLCAEVLIGFADLLSPTDLNGVATPVIDMPEGAIVTDLQIIVETVFNSGTSDVIDIGDNDVADRYLDGSDIQTAAVRFHEDIDAAAETVKQYVAGDTINMTWVAVGADPTTGSVRLLVNYIIADRANETQSLKVTNFGAARQP